MGVKRCFIEVDLQIDDFDIEWIEDRIDKKWDEFFDSTITDAARLKPETWRAICSHDEIWYNSSFIGQSGQLLIEMLEMGLRGGLKNKKVINLHDSDIPYLSKIAVNLIKELQKNNIEFIFSDSPGYPLGNPFWDKKSRDDKNQV